jgi:uncharacterized protein (TIGR03435 family)
VSNVRRTNTAWLVALCAACLNAQQLAPLLVTEQTPRFDVASVTRNLNPDGPRAFSAQGARDVRLINQTVRQILYSAYQTQDYRVVGGPAWLATDRFDVAAKSGTDASLPERLQMVRALLADRFGLRMHAETREQPIYVLEVAERDRRPGPALKVSACVPTGPNGPATADALLDRCFNRNSPGMLAAGGGTLDGLANQLGRLAVIGRPVVNKTELAGAFDYELKFAPDAAASAGGDAVAIFTALREQLGLRLEPSRAPVEVFVIDAANAPPAD